MNEVEKYFKDRAIVRGEILLFSKENALSFVVACKKNNIQILGIDGFFLVENKTQPSLENSIDFSSPGYKSRSGDYYSDAAGYLNDRDGRLCFEIVCSE